MEKTERKHIFWIEEKLQLYPTVSCALEQANYEIRSFMDPAHCLKPMATEPCDFLITDIKLFWPSDFSFLEKVKKLQPALPILCLVGEDDIHLAPQAKRAGADDFVEKPLDHEVLLSILESYGQGYRNLVSTGSTALTKTEKIILFRIMKGLTNRKIAAQMGRSIRTIEYHRNHIMQKLGARNVAELVQIVLTGKPQP